MLLRIALLIAVLLALLPAPTAAEAQIVRVLIREADNRPLVISAPGGLVVRDSAGQTVASGSQVQVELNHWYIERHTPLPVSSGADHGGAARRYPNGAVRYWYGGYSTGSEARADGLAIGGAPVRGTVVVRQGDTIAAVHYREPVTIDGIDGPLRLDGTSYRGTFVVTPGGTGIRIVNHLDREEYLYSVIGAEMSPSWQLEALKAQAVAARTYLMVNLQSRGDYDICATEYCQVYAGMRTEGPRTIQAVDETAGELLLYDGRPISALYSANAGGYTEDSENVFPNAAPYLRSVPSPHDAQAAASGAAASWEWFVTIREDRLVGMLRQEKGGNLRSVQRIVETERTTGGRVIGLRFEGIGDPVTLEQDEVRWVLGLRSNLISADFLPARYEVVPFDDDATRQRLLDEGAYWIADLAAGPGDGPDRAGEREGWSLFRVPGVLRISGRGYGHGVGLSQWGAQGMALEGYNYQEILAHYYPGTTIERVD